MLPLKPACTLSVGDMVDLEGDAFADPDCDPGSAFDCEYAVVCSVKRETDDCVAIGFEGFDLVGFPPDHLLSYAGKAEALSWVRHWRERHGK